MKRIPSLLITLIILIGLVGCSSRSSDDSINNSNKSEDQSTAFNKKGDKDNKNKLEETRIDKNKMEPIVTIEELPLSIIILEPDSIGTRYLEATYTNNSKNTVQGLNITILLKDKNEKTYLSIYDTVLPGETSPKFVTFAPDTGMVDDIEYVMYEIIAAKGDGTTVHLTYDTKLEKYTWF